MFSVNYILAAIFLIFIFLCACFYMLLKKLKKGSYLRGFVLCLMLGFAIGAVILVFRILTGGLI